MPTPTYDLIEEKVLGSAQASVTFSSIPGTYKDLVLEYSIKNTSGTNGTLIKFNNDSGSNYSFTYLNGNGSSEFSGRVTTGLMALADGSASQPNVVIAQIMSYANTNVFKTVLSRGSTSDVVAQAIVGLWRKSPAEAITSIELSIAGGTTFQSGSLFRLWGVAG